MLAVVLAAIIPIHGLVLENRPDRAAIVRIDSVVGMLPAQTRRYRFVPRATFAVGTTIDALLDTRPNHTLLQSVAAAAFAPGLPEPARANPVRLGSVMPEAQLVDQNGRLMSWRASSVGRRSCSPSSSRAVPTARSVRQLAVSSRTCRPISIRDDSPLPRLRSIRSTTRRPF